MNTFECFGLLPVFDIDLAALEKAYFTLQRQHHPDKLSHDDAPVGSSRVASLLTSMQINESYQTLKSPLRRAQHLLRIHGLDVMAEKGGVKPSLELLEEIMTQREALSQVQTAPELESLRRSALAQQKDCLARLGEFFAAQNWNQAAQETLRLGYLEKMLDECRQHGRKLDKKQ